MATSASLAKDAYSTAPAANDAGKAQALEAVAQAGTAGQAALSQAQSGIDSNRAAAIQSAVSGGFGGQAITAGQKDLGFLDSAPGGPANPNSALGALSASNQLASDTLGRDTVRKQGAISDYMSQVNAAIPIEQSRTQGAIAKILADQQDAAAQREYNKQIQGLQLQEAQARLAATLSPAAKALSYGDQQKADKTSHENSVRDALSSLPAGYQKAFTAIMGNDKLKNLDARINDANSSTSEELAAHGIDGVDPARLAKIVELYGRPDLGAGDINAALQSILAPTDEEKQAAAIAAAKVKNKKPGKSLTQDFKDGLQQVGKYFPTGFRF